MTLACPKRRVLEAAGIDRDSVMETIPEGGDFDEPPLLENDRERREKQAGRRLVLLGILAWHSRGPPPAFLYSSTAA
jgi:hypothetical protein